MSLNKVNKQTGETSMVAGLGGSSGGHKIQNESGADLTQRDTMQFTGQAKATDDSTNGKTIIDVSPEVIDWDDWRQMTDQEKEAIPEAMIENAPGVDGLLSATLFTKLWENPNPTADFAGQTMVLTSDDYDFLMMLWAYGADGTPKYTPSVIVPKGQAIQLNAATATGSGVGAIYRNIGVTDATHLQASACYLKDMTSTAVEYNTLAVPLVIYGIKKSINLEFSAIASDVSTSADHCMLSDEVTSVEDVIDNLGTASTKSYTTTITQSSSDLPTAGAVYSYVDTMITQALTGSY